MPQELTPAQRLTQAEKLLESAIKLSHSNTAKIDANTEAIQKNVEAIQKNTEAISAQDRKIDRLTEQVGRATEIFIDSMSAIGEMQKEVRGLQVENRRILDHLFGEEENREE